jgi:hypothetical protein
MRRFFLTLAGAAFIVAFIASLATGSTLLTILTAVATFFGSFLANALLHSAGSSNLKIALQFEVDDRHVRIDNMDYTVAIEPKVFFDLITTHPDGSLRLIGSESVSLSHLPKRITGSKYSSALVAVPKQIASRFTDAGMQLVVGVTSIHQNMNFRSLVTETVSFSAFHAAPSPDAEERAAA